MHLHATLVRGSRLQNVTETDMKLYSCFPPIVSLPRIYFRISACPRVDIATATVTTSRRELARAETTDGMMNWAFLLVFCVCCYTVTAIANAR